MKTIMKMFVILALVVGSAMTQQKAMTDETDGGTYGFRYTYKLHWVCRAQSALPVLHDNAGRCMVPAMPGIVHVLDFVTYSKNQFVGEVASVRNSVRIFDGEFFAGEGGEILRFQCSSPYLPVNGDGGPVICSGNAAPQLYGVAGNALSGGFQRVEQNVIHTFTMIGHDEVVPPEN
jgi:hypothetical protein